MTGNKTSEPDSIRKQNRKAQHSFKVEKALFDMNISGKAKLVYMLLLRYANADGAAFPSYSTIKEKCDIGSSATVSKILKELERADLLEKEQGVWGVKK